MKTSIVRSVGERLFLGVDAGSVNVGIVLCNPAGELLGEFYAEHGGNPLQTILSGLDNLDCDRVDGIAVTGTSIEAPAATKRIDPVVALISAARRFHPSAGGVLFVGGERFGLVRFDESRDYRDLWSSTSCAAGSGSFLDQQARRLGLSGPRELATLANECDDDSPDIASRCSVFAKTDIIHAQAQGHSLKGICDGLCKGLARNIAETVVRNLQEEIPGQSVVFAGGVALNDVLKRHLERITGLELLVGEHPQLYGAYGAALGLCEEEESDGLSESAEGLDPRAVFSAEPPRREYYYPPLSAENRQQGTGRLVNLDETGETETTLYVDLEPFATGEPIPVVVGLDIGSTSTKLALLLDSPKNSGIAKVLLALYTRTRGEPLEAARRLFAQIGRLSNRYRIEFRVTGLSTTGSGRKYVGAVVGADLIIDEISAHARAAYEIDPLTDTIIEIGGQDSKFTTLQNGRVTFCQMNTVCAAGTGSFLEEQAIRLRTRLDDFEKLAIDVSAPLTSDRCTVFMERDINACLSRGYTDREMLAASVRAVCENYLTKVAVEARIGHRVAFQGATARNAALVSAFRERLDQEILVSEYCHITGALGAALCYQDERDTSEPRPSRFRGIDALSLPIQVEVEECTYCVNRCQIRVTEIAGQRVGYGFACGREYETKRKVPKKGRRDLLTLHDRILKESFAKEMATVPQSVEPQTSVGLTTTLPSPEDAQFWRLFFASVGIDTIFPEHSDVATGRQLAGADFCAPMMVLHAQISELSQRTDWIFAPLSVGPHPALRREEGSDANEPKYCYYTQFSSSLAGILTEGKARLLSPVFKSTDSIAKTVTELQRALKPFDISHNRVKLAYDRASRALADYRDSLSRSFLSSFDPTGSPSVMLLGRPYVVFSSAMNRGIPESFSDLGVMVYYQDMVPPEVRVGQEVEALRQRFRWHYPLEMLRAADYAARTDGLYPVLMTTFKCSPDSFFIEYFKRLLDRYRKPYLILQLDDLDSSIGYETRIEAAVRSFRNHRGAASLQEPDERRKRSALQVAPKVEQRIDGRTLLLPNWDPLSCPLLAANLRRAGVDARVLEEDHGLIRRAMRLNTGQCVPLNVIVEEFVEYVRRHDLDPNQTMLWMPKSELACNFNFFGPYMKTLLEGYGSGMERASVYEGDIYYMELSPVIAMRAYFAYLAGGMVRRLGCRIRPYESQVGTTDAAIARSQELLVGAFEGSRPLGTTLSVVAELFDAIERTKPEVPRPKAALFGDLYVRDNEVFNHDLIKTIEAAGGEAVTTPYNEYLKIIGRAYFSHWMHDHQYKTLAEYRALLAIVEGIESRFTGILDGYTLPRLKDISPSPKRTLADFHIGLDQEGESLDNVLKIIHLVQAHPDISLFVQTSPAFCCPSLITEAMSTTIQKLTGIPVVTISYDGTEDIKNDLVIPYLSQSRARVDRTATASK